MVKALVIDPSTVDKMTDALNKHTPVILLYHMKLCGHCVAMRSAWESCAKAFKGRNGLIAEVEYNNINCLPPTMRDIAGFPTIKMFKEIPKQVSGHLAVEYEGDRSAQSILDFALNHCKAVKPAMPAKAAKPKPKPNTSLVQKPKPKDKATVAKRRKLA